MQITNVNPFLYFVGFQGDFVYNANIIQFQTPFVVPAGLTGTTGTFRPTF